MAEGFMVNRRRGIPALEKLSWSQIANISEAGKASKYWNIGDEKDIILSTDEVLTMQIYDFDHDDLTGGGKAGITFGMKDLMINEREMEDSPTNANGWGGCEMYGWLSGTLFYQLPQDLQDVIKPVDKLTSEGDMSFTIETTSDKIFLFSVVECFGESLHTVEGEGEQYPIFTNNISRIKKLSNGDGAVQYWWVRSPSVTNRTHFCNVDTNGDSGHDFATEGFGVCFGFCV